MKVFVKTLKGTHFEIEVNPQDTVADVKKQVETSQGRNVYPADQQMLVHQGKILKDKTTLDENKVSESSFLVIMLSKTRGSSSGTSNIVKAPANQAPPTGTVPPNPSTLASHPPQAPAWASTPILASAPTPTATAAPASAVAISTETDVYGQAASNLVAGNNFEQVIQQILDMGGGSWDRDTIVRALRAAYNNPERAVEYLYSGIPEHTEAVPVAQTPTGGQPSNVPVQALQPARVNVPFQAPQPVHANVPIQAPQPARVNVPVQAPQPVHANVPVQAPQPIQTAAPSSGPNASPLDLFPQGLPSLGSNTGMGSLDFLRNSPQFRALQTMVQANPQILQPMLQELGKQNPNVMRLIQEHQAEFLRLINEPSEGAEGNLLGQLEAGMQQTVIVSQEEREAIERLEAMGFDRTLVLEVFFACNKNEELAANYLVDHMHEFEE